MHPCIPAGRTHTLSDMAEVTQILTALAAGDPKRAEELLPLVYDELRSLAAARLALEQPGNTLQPTALVHEAYLRLVGDEEAWNTHDMKSLAKLFREDAEWVNKVGMHWCGRDEIMVAHTAFHRTIFKNHSYHTDAVETRSVAPGVAVAVVTQTFDGFMAPDGRAWEQSRSSCLPVVRRFRVRAWAKFSQRTGRTCRHPCPTIKEEYRQTWLRL